MRYVRQATPPCQTLPCLDLPGLATGHDVGDSDVRGVVEGQAHAVGGMVHVVMMTFRISWDYYDTGECECKMMLVVILITSDAFADEDNDAAT